MVESICQYSVARYICCICERKHPWSGKQATHPPTFYLSIFLIFFSWSIQNHIYHKSILRHSVYIVEKMIRIYSRSLFTNKLNHRENQYLAHFWRQPLNNLRDSALVPTIEAITMNTSTHRFYTTLYFESQ